MSSPPADSNAIPQVTDGSRTATRGRAGALLRTDDGVRIEAAYEPGPGPVGGPVIVLAHGFTGDLERPHVRRAARVFARYAAVVTFSFRGHGRSGGRSTVGDREVLDLAAAVTWARSLGHSRVITVGFSMGGSVVLRHAALHGAAAGETPAPAPGVAAGPAGEADGGRTEARTGAPGTADRVSGEQERERERQGKREEAGPGEGAGAPETAGPEAPGGDRPEGPAVDGPGARTVSVSVARTDAVVAVSSPARWYYRGTAPMRRLHWLVTRPLGRVVGRVGLRTRIHDRDWDPVPLSPTAAVPLIAPTPLLLVHGERDPYFPVDHPRMLAAASDGHAELWLEPGMGHAEHAADDALLERIARWARDAVPDRRARG
ncbi:alpha/beta fold hydrolase [Streptomyces sp. NPDC007088]|uniref:alpha/beta hydrolase n=1 Tax=Streptomyces sp. NPDC007088 TaxID=3364773 RepID=UPI003685E1F1